MSVFCVEHQRHECKCGCHTEVNPWADWAKGHWTRSEEGRAFRREEGSKTFSDYWNNLSSKDKTALLDRSIHSTESRKKTQDHFLEPGHSDKVMSGIIKYRKESELAAFERFKYRWLRLQEMGMLICKCGCGGTVTPGRDYISGHNPSTEESRALISAGQPLFRDEKFCKASTENNLKYWRSLTPEQYAARIAKCRRVQAGKPNRLESSLLEWLEEDFSGKWKYVGDAALWLEGRNPDFVDEEDKAIIELFGEYWHQETDPTNRKSEEGTIAHYEKLGYKCLVVWVSGFDDLLYEWCTTVTSWVKSLNVEATA